MIHPTRNSHCRLALAAFAASLGCVVMTSGQERADAQEAKANLDQEHYFSLKSFEEDRGFKRIGPQSEKCVQFEPEGMRITLSAGRNGERPNTGLNVPCPIKGDFEITVSFEVLQEPDLTDAKEKATKIGLLAHLDSPVGRKAGFTQRYLSGERIKVITWINFKDPETGKFPSKLKAWNIAAKSGRLRLVRSGPEVGFYLAEGKADFELIQGYPLGEEDLKEVELVSSTGGPKGSIDVRFADLRIRSGSAPGPAAAGEAASSDAGDGSWLLPSLVVAGALVIVVGYGLTVFSRRRRPGGAPKSSMNEGPGIAHATVQCPACGKDLKVKAELAGKQVKCPKCGQVVLLPASLMPAAVEPSQVPAGSKRGEP